MYQSRLSLSPAVEQQFKELTRITRRRSFYNDLLAKETRPRWPPTWSAVSRVNNSGHGPGQSPAVSLVPESPLFAAGGLGVGLPLG